jgi:hypothetical protein
VAIDFSDTTPTTSRVTLLSPLRADDIVDDALAGHDQGELITIPSLPDAADWQAYEAARQKLMPNLSLEVRAARYRTRAAADI